MSGYLIEDDMLALVPYTIDDAPDWLACWQDVATQRGFNHIMPNDLQCVLSQEITRFPFWVVAVEKKSGARLGVLRLSPDPAHPDLAIWMYPQSRGRGYGTRAFALSLAYLFTHGYDAIYAGCFAYNVHSLAILRKNGFVRWPEGDMKEMSVFDGMEITMLGFRCPKL